jgi:hypothetical protein
MVERIARGLEKPLTLPPIAPRSGRPCPLANRMATVKDWLIQVEGDEWDLETLRARLAQADPRALQHGGKTLLESSEVQGIGDEADAKQRAREIVRIVNGAMSFEGGNGFEHVRFAGLVRIDGDGLATYDSETATVRFRVRSSKARAQLGQVSAVPGWLSQVNNPSLRAVFRLLGQDQLDWYDLYKIFELVRDDTDQKQVEQWAGSRKELTRFTRSANHPQAIGEAARHGVNRQPPPADSMAHDDAVGLIRRVALCWLRTK